MHESHYREAEELLWEAIEIQKRVLGPDRLVRP